MAAVQWTEELERVLISFYMEHQCLWNIKAKAYKNRDLRKAALEELCQQLKLNSGGHQVVEQDVKKKFKNLRTVFTREHAAVVESSRSGAGAAEIYVPKWKYYQQLLFLRDSCGMDESEDNLKVQEEPEAPTSPEAPISPCEGLSPQKRKPTGKQNGAEKKAAEAMEYAMGFLKRKEASKHTGFLHYLENLLDDIPDSKIKK
ncbi:uncharacterized protein LOC134442596 [Engraulis encrasicolus]|uniref:uncharacterized protein LOC134442596 n=1 Tax=Engraulis encrasicolus TaxID=184585 RepID=UPI002FD02284